MEQRFLTQTSASEPLVLADVAPLAATPSEPRQTVVYRLPQAFPPPVILAPPRDLTFGRVLFHLFLLAVTASTTVLSGMFLFRLSLRSGIIYSFSVLAILTAHEMGHYIACRWYGVQATPPYFIPFFIPILGMLQAGTFGAFIKIKAPIPTRRALFDIGIAGPLAGFVFLFPVAFIAHYFAQPANPEGVGLTLQDPLLFRFFHRLLHLPSDLMLNPAMFGAWIGALMTSLNLLPVGQLDGGHVTYATLGARGHKAVSIGCYLAVIGLAIYGVSNGTWNWVVWVILLTLMMRAGHPPVMDEEESLGFGRVIVAIIGLLVFILCFMPFPISF